MANPYYGVGGVPATQARGASVTIRSEFTAVQTGFDAVQTAIAAVAGAGTTGTQLVLTATSGATPVKTIRSTTAGNLEFVNSAGTGVLVSITDAGQVTFSGSLIGNLTGSATGSAASITGVNPVANGGTGVATLAGIPYGNGTAAVTSATANQIVSTIGATAVANATTASNALALNGQPASYYQTAGGTFTGAVNGTTGTFSGAVAGTTGMFTGALTGASASVTGDIQSASQNGGPLAGMRNRIINGNFQINNRTVSGTVTLAAGVYGHDRWKAGAGGCTYTFATSGIDTVITVTVGTLMQVIEGANIEGGVYRLSQQGTAQAHIAVNGAATSGAYAANPQSSASATGGQNVTIEFTTGTIDRVMFEPGTTASTFERRQIGYEINACARYLPVYNYGSANGAAPLASAFANSSVLAVIPLIFQVPARVPPTGFSVSSFGNFQFSGPGAAYPISGMSLIGSSIYGVQINATISGATAGTGGQFQIITPMAFILFNGCEL